MFVCMCWFGICFQLRQLLQKLRMRNSSGFYFKNETSECCVCVCENFAFFVGSVEKKNTKRMNGGWNFLTRKKGGGIFCWFDGESEIYNRARSNQTDNTSWSLAFLSETRKKKLVGSQKTGRDSVACREIPPGFWACREIPPGFWACREIPLESL